MSPEDVQEEVLAERGPAGVLPCVPKSAGNVCGDFLELKQKCIAFKFGGSSLLGAQRMLNAAHLVRAASLSSPVVVVVSAMKGVTDRLLAIGRHLEQGNRVRARNEAESVAELHFDVLADLQEDELDVTSVPSFDFGSVRHDLHLLTRDLLHECAASLVPVSPSGVSALHDRLASFGERFSARLFAAALEKAGVAGVPVASSDFIVTCDTFRDAAPDLEETRRRGRSVLFPLLHDGLVPVVTGFLGATCHGHVTTLGRNSSDFSGAIIAHVVDAAELVIWTDVDGIYTANPHVNREARLLHELSYDEAHALAASGAKVLHAKVLPLAAETEMVVWVRNTFNPAFRGTRIGPRSSNSSQRGEA